MQPGTRLREDAYRRREAIALGLSGDQLFDEMIAAMNNGRSSTLIVRRPQLTWRVIGFAEALGGRVLSLCAVADDDEIFVIWHEDSEVRASIEAWREAERRLRLPRCAQHYVVVNEARRQTVRPAAA
jgi:hypothetical protein